MTSLLVESSVWMILFVVFVFFEGLLFGLFDFDGI